MNTTLITIIGPSGAGKDTAARILSELTGIPVLVSYTTRPMREGEQQGCEHYFVKECTCPKDQMLAYTQYGGYEYWTEFSQVKDKAIYVIDEDGLRELMKKAKDFDVVGIYIEANRYVRRMRGVSLERMNRDLLRESLSANSYKYRLTNNGSMEDFVRQLREVVERMNKCK